MATICKKEDSINRLSTNITYALKHNGINLKDFDKALIERELNQSVDFVVYKKKSYKCKKIRDLNVKVIDNRYGKVSYNKYKNILVSNFINILLPILIDRENKELNN
ncbi:hypothetical protein EPJ64_00895 [Brachyspira aalborgi]|uniref:Uncharacterized protein n=1 Tax=Brachyspira aalborgi TaxID=29522 RepID=A0A5C8E9C0_9SPIR|nr:hypothetical protein [Brachyspira aalborgi]MBS4763621.1 hypothetical protein [Brachyspira sp.]TXJ16633.1 hypothetical protein EPJ77_02630 [Brachyspira aalborgi]TXJ22737.1 hypothetical protein EPJ64_00895 [Brachyspira aalborgi]TXJ28452.1 hypothetical protein EPJ73_00395 [Brachyspira aalborgi]TXJ34365.1 hypothetical protein EPJ71_00420 [Brachyspira aalborgi]